MPRMRVVLFSRWQEETMMVDVSRSCKPTDVSLLVYLCGGLYGRTNDLPIVSFAFVRGQAWEV